MPEASRNDLKNEFPDRVTLAVIPNSSHALLPEQPAAVVKAIAEWVESCRSYSATTGFLSTPIPLISISHTSPGFMFSGTPSVPIHITSPGSMVQYLLTSAM